MLKNRFKIISFFLITFFTISCVSKKKIIYFQNDTPNVEFNNKFELTFKQNDLLTINVSSVDVEAVRPFNLPTVSYSAITNSVNGNAKHQSYLIDSNGNINFPVIGKIKLEGLTRVEAIDLITNKIKPYVKAPSVNIQISNFYIKVLGDVRTPGRFLIIDEKVTIIDALALAGDLNISGERIIEVKRDSPKGIVTGYLDLKSNKIYNSPFYYLQQNDLIYVRQNNAKLQSASYNQNTGLFITISSVLVSLIAVLTR